MSAIGTLQEGPLHAALKSHYRTPGDVVEARVGGYFVDILGSGGIVEIQTASFSAIRRKLETLLESHTVRLVHPIGVERWIVRVDASGEILGRRKSPKRLGVEDVFEQLVSLAALLDHPRLVVDVVTTRLEEIRTWRKRRRRRKFSWQVAERRLLEVLDTTTIARASDLLRLLPDELPEPFSTRDLAGAMNRPLWLAQKAAYCLRESGVVRLVGKRGNLLTYTRSEAEDSR
jgi:hypothetical protein